jgi:hypothetical protein
MFTKQIGVRRVLLSFRRTPTRLAVGRKWVEKCFVGSQLPETELRLIFSESESIECVVIFSTPDLNVT